MSEGFLAPGIWVKAMYMGKGNISTGNRFPNKMEGEHVVPLVQLGLELGRTPNHRFIITKQVGLLADRNTQLLEGVAQVNYLPVRRN
jgi:hypothetical protein